MQFSVPKQCTAEVCQLGLYSASLIFLLLNVIELAVNDLAMLRRSPLDS